MDQFKQRLAYYMKKAGLNPTSLAKKAGLSQTAVRDILDHVGDPNPRIDTFIKLCRALGLRPYHLSAQIERLYPPHLLRLLEEAEAEIRGNGKERGSSSASRKRGKKR
jgi:DNA-binding XRE family transcriptional regulator